MPCRNRIRRRVRLSPCNFSGEILMSAARLVDEPVPLAVVRRRPRIKGNTKSNVTAKVSLARLLDWSRAHGRLSRGAAPRPTLSRFEVPFGALASPRPRTRAEALDAKKARSIKAWKRMRAPAGSPHMWTSILRHRSRTAALPNSDDPASGFSMGCFRPTNGLCFRTGATHGALSAEWTRPVAAAQARWSVAG